MKYSHLNFIKQFGMVFLTVIQDGDHMDGVIDVCLTKRYQDASKVVHEL